MPGLDGTGPRGEGTATGGGFGVCGAAREYRGFGCGRGRGRFMHHRFSDGDLADEVRALRQEVNDLTAKIAPDERFEDEDQ